MVKTAFFLLFGWAASASSGPSITPSSSPTIPCSFNIKNFKYDLCPLLGSHVRNLKLTISEDTPPTLTRKMYQISLEGALTRDGTLPAELQCPGGTWICLIVTNTRPNHDSEPTRILQVVPIAAVNQRTGPLTPKFKLLRTDNDTDNDNKSTPRSISLRMSLNGGIYTGQKQKAVFVFECDRSRERAERTSGIPSTPKFSWSFNGTHTFNWKSVYACPDTLVSPHPPAPGNDHETDTDKDDGDVDPPVDPDTEAEAEEPIDLDYTSPRSALGPYSLLWIPLLLLVLYIASKKLIPPATRRLCSSARWRLGRYRFLVGSDPGTGTGLPSDEDGPRGYEVNPDLYAYGVVDGEEIPLSPSPRKDTFGYGVLR
ncbi:hypothetical protein E1B28_002703 [Marasmius oreades]|uniref:Autophagy-related protein 27 n=1 Tax=Marasmius oreades TaxID=181124 RepID=A0A9P7RPP1_9AGAR|nr:uncharacterized protein E1B28_002703 [Marasmius oreades]KAG7086773.1 hypothetical protein E1B28_002703 [Marasmius oreades]